MLVLSLALLSAVPPGAPQEAWPPDPPVFPGVLIGIDEAAHVLTADLDGDGDLDLATIGHSPTSLRVHLGTGAGSFVADARPPVSIPPGVPPGILLRGAVAADFDGDGDPDVAVMGDLGFEGRLYTFLNDGGGALSLHTSHTFQKWGEALSAIDVEGDGWMDLVMIRKANPGLQLLRSLGPAGFAAPQWIDAPAGWWGAHDYAVGDVDGDGRADLLTLNHGSMSATPMAFLYANDGLGGFLAPAPLFEVGAFSQRVLLADLRGDGVLHAAVVEKKYSQAPTLSWFENDGSAGFALRQRIEGAGFPPEVTRDLAVRDLDGDGREEWVVTLPSGNLGRLVLAGSTLGLSGDELVTTGGPWRAAGDFDSDGDEDLLARHASVAADDELALFPGDGTGGLRGVIVSGEAPPWMRPTLLDFDGDGHLDMVVGDLLENVLDLHRGLGDGRFEWIQSIPTRDGPLEVVVGDFNGDGALDFALTAGIYLFVELLIQTPGHTFQSAGSTLPYSVGFGYTFGPLHVLDSDADGRDEVALLDSLGRLVLIGLDDASQTGILAALDLPTVKSINAVIEVAPGLPEALELVAPGTASYLSLWVLSQPLGGTPPTLLERLALPLHRPPPQVDLLFGPLVRDLDGDGLREVWAIHRAESPQLTNASLWPGALGGSFGLPESYRTPYYLAPRWAEDVDGDGALDFGYLFGWTPTGFPDVLRLQVHRPALGGSLGRPAAYPWIGHDSGDVDGDGRLDLVVVVNGRVVSLLNLTGR